MEIKAIAGFENYFVTEDGKVYLFDFSQTREVKQYRLENGYMQVLLYNHNGKHHKYVHRLVAEAFIDNPENKTQVDHIDSNRANNHVDNLRWCTNKENHNFSNCKKPKNKRKKDIFLLLDAEHLFNDGATIREICDFFRIENVVAFRETFRLFRKSRKSRKQKKELR